MKKRISAVVIATLLIVATLVGCGQKTLESYINSHADAKEEMDASIAETLKSMSDVYSDLYYEVSGNTFTYYYVFKDKVDSSVNFSSMDGLYKNISYALIDALKEETEISEPITIEYKFINSDKSELETMSYTK